MPMRASQDFGWRTQAGACLIFRVRIMTEQPVNLTNAIYLGVFSRAEQRVLQAIFNAIAEGGGECVATLTRLARDSNTSKSTTRNAIARAVALRVVDLLVFESRA